MVLENSHQNEVTKRMNMTILEGAQSMRICARLSKQFYEDAVNTVVYLINRGPSMILNCEISDEAWTDKEVTSTTCVLLIVSYMSTWI